MLDKIKSFIKEKMGDGDSADIAKAYNENQVVLQGLTNLNMSLQAGGQPEDALGISDEKFLAALRKEGRGF